MHSEIVIDVGQFTGSWGLGGKSGCCFTHSTFDRYSPASPGTKNFSVPYKSGDWSRIYSWTIFQSSFHFSLNDSGEIEYLSNNFAASIGSDGRSLILNW